MPNADQQARAFADRFWDQLLELEPVLGTRVGDDRFDDRLPDASEAGLARRQQVLAGALRGLAGMDRSALGVEARTTLAVAEAIASSGLDAVTHRLDQFDAVSHLFGPGQLLAELGSLQQAGTPERADRYRARLAAIPAWLAQVAEAARSGAAAGRTAPRLVVDRAIGQVTRLLEGDPAQSPGMAPLAALGGGAPEREAVAAVLAGEVWPAYQRYLDALIEYRAHARRSIGLAALPGGDAIYASQIRARTTLPLTAEQVHAIGLEELAAIQEEEQEIAGRLGHSDAPSAVAAYTATGENTAGSREELLALAEAQVARGLEAAPAFFGRLPAARCEVRPVEPFRERDMPPAFYYPPSGDGARPGIYYINLSDLPSRPLHSLAAVSYHEAIPGHHFQLSIEQEFSDRPPLRRFGGILGGNAFAEGWGLYCERLAGEMGLYRDDYERLGMLTAQAWRAVRLIVDSGIHALGWSRERAVELAVSAGLPQPTAEVEVDRYIAWPAQALSYKIGQRELESLRADAAGRRGFSLPAFHDRVMELGTLPLPALRAEMLG
ncbi:MAG TPA: DUF885 domain-containing protein [Actinomycetota bacterium]|nr:DUF885 domain-containing protein [Actinomycetota bacterium]